MSQAATIGRYHVVEPLGGGPLGEVFRAKVYGVAGFEKQFAVKRIHAALVADPALGDMIAAAARSYATIEHPRIARMHEIGTAGGATFVAVELVPGVDASRLLATSFGEGEPLSPGASLSIIMQAARAIAYAHGRGVPHLGLCPTNILVTPEGDVKVCDFAFLRARLRGRVEGDPSLAARLPYLGPEQLVGGQVSPATDVFQLATIAHELLTGERAFSGRDAAAKIRSGQRPEAPIAVPIRQVLARAWSQAPDDRYLDAGAFADALDAAMRQAPQTGGRTEVGAAVRRAIARASELASQQVSGAMTFPLPAAPTDIAPSVPLRAPPPMPPPPPNQADIETRKIGKFEASQLAEEMLLEPDLEDDETIDRGKPDAGRAAASPPPPPIPPESRVAKPVVPEPPLALPLPDPTAPSEQLERRGSAAARGVPGSSEDDRAHARSPDGTPSLIDNELTERALPTIEGSLEIAVEKVTRPATSTEIVPPLTPPRTVIAEQAIHRPPPPPDPDEEPPPRRSLAWLWGILIVAVVGVGAVVVYTQVLAKDSKGPTYHAFPKDDPVSSAPVVALATSTKTALAPVAASTPIPVPVPVASVATSAAPAVVATANPDAGVAPRPAADGKLSINSDPPGAFVYLDGALKGKTPVELPATGDRHKLALILPKYKLHREEITGSVNVTLEPVQKLKGDGGIKVIHCPGPDRAYVTLDGIDTGQLCPTDRLDCEVGLHKVDVYDPVTDTTTPHDVEVKETHNSLRVKAD